MWLNKFIIKIIFIASFLLGVSHPNISFAQKKTIKQVSPKYSELVINANTGEILHSDNADKIRYPASLTKMMTLYLTFEHIKKGKLNLNLSLPVSSYAASRPKSNLSLKPGEIINVRDAILALVVKSANDISVVLAEAISGSEQQFVDLMNERAIQLGMRNTKFKNVSGLHHNEQKTTAIDMAKLAIALRRDFAEYYHFFARKSFIYKGIVYKTHNHVTADYPGADGLKTGFVNASGFNLVTSATRGQVKLIGVIMGGASAKSRDSKMTQLLNKYFGHYGIASIEKPAKDNLKLTENNTVKKAKAKNIIKSNKKINVASITTKANKPKKLKKAT